MADEVGELIGRYRRRQGLTQRQAAERWGLGPRTLETWELRGPRPAMRGLLAAALRDALGDEVASG